MPKKRFSVSVPRAGYISAAFTEFSKHLSSENEIEIFYKETNSLRAIKNILEEEYRLGIVRYAESHDKYYKKMLDEKELSHELIAEFTYELVMSENSPLAKKEKITFADLAEHIEIAHGDPFVPSLPTEAVKKRSFPISDDAYSFLSAAVSMSCFRKIPTPSCGSLPYRKRRSNAILLSAAPVTKTRRYTEM